MTCHDVLTHFWASLLKGPVLSALPLSELWKSHFGRLLNVIQDAGLCDISCDTEYSDDIHVSTNEVVLAVQALGANKASGLDGIVAEHLLYSSERWCTMLAMCLSGLFVHGFFT